jgi:hypothetical protein
MNVEAVFALPLETATVYGHGTPLRVKRCLPPSDRSRASALRPELEKDHR